MSGATFFVFRVSLSFFFRSCARANAGERFGQDDNRTSTQGPALFAALMRFPPLGGEGLVRIICASLAPGLDNNTLTCKLKPEEEAGGRKTAPV